MWHKNCSFFPKTCVQTQNVKMYMPNFISEFFDILKCVFTQRVHMHQGAKLDFPLIYCYKVIKLHRANHCRRVQFVEGKFSFAQTDSYCMQKFYVSNNVMMQIHRTLMPRRIVDFTYMCKESNSNPKVKGNHYSTSQSPPIHTPWDS